MRLRPFDRSVGLVLAAFIVLLVLENFAIGIGYRTQFVAMWEMNHARFYLSPIALALALPIALATVLIGRLTLARRAVAVAALAAFFGAAIAWGVSSGRHFSILPIRIAFVVLVGCIAGLTGFLLAQQVLRLRARVIALIGALIAAIAWLADAFVLPRLYPAFHFALFFITLFAWAAVTLPLRKRPIGGPIAAVAIVIGTASLAWSPFAAQRVARSDNLRRVLLERAPLLGRAVMVASKLAPPPPIEDDAAAASTVIAMRGSHGRALDWSNRDLVVITIDALRADHVGAYGYNRPTTPNIDRLAARGVRFDRAYCPTPHTSYSVTSMMTGKYMRPLLAMDATDDGETWATHLQRYGWRTAAFYPPAVFFIDEHRFEKMKTSGLGFEYRKEEFAAPELRRSQITKYVEEAPKDKPLFLWVHLFEPHEPYVMHPDHPFSGDPKVDAYDSEIAEADATVGAVMEILEQKREQKAVFIVSADHGEELGDHGGRYHGTTVYEEQVRVPLVIAGEGTAPRVVGTPVQTIDLLPTMLAAIDVPVPPRLRGRDLGPLVAGTQADDEGLAFAETDDWTLVARGSDRLICARKIASCTLFDIKADPGQQRAVGDRPERVLELRKLTAAIERENGKLEASELPEAMRRCLQGDRDAAEDVAPLFDDARVAIRRGAARCAFKLRAQDMIPHLRRALGKDEDEGVRRFSTVALLRLGEKDMTGAVVKILADGEPEERVAAALALAEQGDIRGEIELVKRWNAMFAKTTRGDLDEARELLAAFAKIRSRTAVPALAASIEDVRLRPYIVDALAAIGDRSAKNVLLITFANERYVHLRPKEARALIALGARVDELEAPLTRFAGTPEPMPEALLIAREARLLSWKRGSVDFESPLDKRKDKGRVRVRGGPSRLFVLTGGEGPLTGTINKSELPEIAPWAGNTYVAELGDIPAGDIEVNLTHPVKVIAFWIVPRAEDIPPPPPEEPEPEP